MLESFHGIINRIKEYKYSESVSFVSEFLENVSREDLVKAFTKLYSYDFRNSIRKIATNSPTIFPLYESHGYFLEALMWYPQPENLDVVDYESDDIHDHFGWIVSRMIIGDGYIEERFSEREKDLIYLESTSSYRESSINIIAPEDIHRIYYKSRRVSISIRVVFPPCRAEMRIFGGKPLMLKKIIECSIERKLYELAVAFHTLDASNFSDQIEKIKKSMMKRESLSIFESLVYSN